MSIRDSVPASTPSVTLETHRKGGTLGDIIRQTLTEEIPFDLAVLIVVAALLLAALLTLTLIVAAAAGLVGILHVAVPLLPRPPGSPQEGAIPSWQMRPLDGPPLVGPEEL